MQEWQICHFWCTRCIYTRLLQNAFGKVQLCCYLILPTEDLSFILQPGYVSSAEDLKAKGIKDIFCVAVNDPFVMAAWSSNQNADGKVRMLADTCGDLTKALELELDLAKVLGNVRCKRFSILVEDGKAAQVNVEPDGTGLTCSLASSLKL